MRTQSLEFVLEEFDRHVLLSENSHKVFANVAGVSFIWVGIPGPATNACWTEMLVDYSAYITLPLAFFQRRNAIAGLGT